MRRRPRRCSVRPKTAPPCTASQRRSAPSNRLCARRPRCPPPPCRPATGLRTPRAVARRAAVPARSTGCRRRRAKSGGASRAATRAVAYVQSKASMAGQPEHMHICQLAEAGGQPELDLALAGRAGGRIGRGLWAAASHMGSRRSRLLARRSSSSSRIAAMLRGSAPSPACTVRTQCLHSAHAVHMHMHMHMPHAHAHAHAHVHVHVHDRHLLSCTC